MSAVEVVVAVAPSSGAEATARLPDPRRSYAVLIGSSRYGSAGLSDLPAVAGNLAGLAEVVPDPASAQAAGRALCEYAARAKDTLLVYWAGYGGPGPGGEFQLSVAGAADGLPAGALPVGRIREAMLG